MELAVTDSNGRIPEIRRPREESEVVEEIVREPPVVEDPSANYVERAAPEEVELMSTFEQTRH